MSSVDEIQNPLFEPSLTTIGAVGLGGTALCLIASVLYAISVFMMKRGNKEMIQVANAIAKGTVAFLFFEYLCLSVFMLLVLLVVSLLINWQTGVCFIVGVFCSSFAGAVGMFMSVANVRTAAAAEWSMLMAFRTAISAASVLGLSVVGVAIGGISFFLLVFGQDSITKIYLGGFGLGCTTVSLFSRVGGGIFTKAADVGADLVGKVEVGIPEDDARNPAAIADNVGDNVGDVAGMSADLCGSLAGSLVAAIILGYDTYLLRGAGYPLWIVVFGIISSICGNLSLFFRNNASRTEVVWAMRLGLLTSSLAQFLFMALVTFLFSIPWRFYAISCSGLICGFLISFSSEFYTSHAYYYTRSIARSGRMGAAMVVMQGLAVGMYSCAIPAILSAALLVESILLGGVYGAAIASTALLSNLAFILSTDASGAVFDNAGGIAEMAHLPDHVRARTDDLDSIGNTTAAVGKSFAISSALLTGYSLINIFKVAVGLDNWDAASDGLAVGGLLIGAVLPFFFCGMIMEAVSRCAYAVIDEVRSQLTPEVLRGEKTPNYAKCVIQITANSLHSMIAPAMLVILTPVILGVFFPLQFLLALLLANTVTGFCLSTMWSNSGGAWDNAKKYIEAGHYGGGKGSDVHKAAVVGDTVGDPCKDALGPACNIAIKLCNYMGVVLAPFFLKRHSYWWSGFIILALGAIIVIPIMILTPVRVEGWYHRLFSKKGSSDSGGDVSASTPAPEPYQARAQEEKHELEQRIGDARATRPARDSERDTSYI